MHTEAWLQADEWLTGFLGRRVFRLKPEDALLHDPHGAVKVKEALCREPCFAYAKTGTQEHRKLEFLEELGFRLIDTNISMEKSRDPLHPSDPVRHARFASSEDREAVRTLAQENFVYSRFHLDPRIGQETADRIKAGWAENYFLGKRGDHLVVGGPGASPEGFLLLLRSGVDLVIDLIAVAGTSRRRGMAAGMIAFAEREIPGVERILVGTQVANIPSIRLYEKLGFRVYASSYVFHFHHKG